MPGQISRFDPDPDIDHSVCVTCKASLPTAQDSENHMTETLEQAEAAYKLDPTSPRSSHTVRRMNPTRAERIRDHIDETMNEAINDTIEALAELTTYEGTLTEDELRAGFSDWSAYEDRLEGVLGGIDDYGR